MRGTLRASPYAELGLRPRGPRPTASPKLLGSRNIIGLIGTLRASPYADLGLRPRGPRPAASPKLLGSRNIIGMIGTLRASPYADLGLRPRRPRPTASRSSASGLANVCLLLAYSKQLENFVKIYVFSTKWPLA